MHQFPPPHELTANVLETLGPMDPQDEGSKPRV